VPPNFTGAQLAAPAGANWLGFGGSSYGQRYSTLNAIKVGNANKLAVAWKTDLGEPKGQNTAGALEYNGTFYIPSVQGDIFALNATTGQQIWKYTAATSGGARGLAMGNGLIYYAEKDCTFVAVHADTGTLAWRSAQVCDPTKNYSFAGPPTYTSLNGGEVLEGTSGSDSGIRGELIAVNAKTGALLWQHYFVPLNASDPGYSSWGQPADFTHGGAGVWTQPTVDPTLGLIYVATANAAPYANRPPGNDLYTASDVALNAQGKMVWYYQTVHHDEWDYDIPQSPTLVDYSIKGKLVHALDQPTKMGENFILNRATGKPLILTPETAEPQLAASPNTSKTQPIPSGDMFAEPCATAQEWLSSGNSTSTLGPDGNPIIFGCDFTPVLSTNYTVSGWHDVADWLPSTFDQSTGLFYICATENRGKGYESVPLAEQNGAVAYSDKGLSSPDNAYGHTGEIFAYDLRTNKIAWKTLMPDANSCYAGLSSTAGRVLFVGTTDGHFLALDAGNGQLLYESPQLAGSIGSSPIVYQGTDGREYVALIVGGTSEGGSIAIQNDIVYSFALPSS
jgi:glucose dehydrogenase